MQISDYLKVGDHEPPKRLEGLYNAKDKLSGDLTRLASERACSVWREVKPAGHVSSADYVGRDWTPYRANFTRIDDLEVAVRTLTDLIAKDLGPSVQYLESRFGPNLPPSDETFPIRFNVMGYVCLPNAALYQEFTAESFPEGAEVLKCTCYMVTAYVRRAD